MNRARTFLLGAGCAAFVWVAYGADGATALLPADSAAIFKLSGNAGDFAKVSTADVSGQPFAKALRIEVSKKPARSQDVQLSAPVDAPTSSGDVMLVSFWMRSGGPGE